jgi:hypothetical protein
MLYHITNKKTFILKKLSLKTNWISQFTKLKKSIPKNWLNELESENSTKKNQFNQEKPIKFFIFKMKIPRKNTNYRGLISSVL